MPAPIRVRIRPNLARHAGVGRTRAGFHQVVALAVLPVTQFLEPYEWEFRAVVLPVVVRSRDIAQQQTFAGWPPPCILTRIVEYTRKYLVEPLPAACDHIGQRGKVLAEQHAAPVRAEPLPAVLREVHQQRIGRTPTARALVQTLVHRAAQKQRLRAGLGLPD